MPSHLNRMAGMASVPMLVSLERHLVAPQASLEDFFAFLVARQHQPHEAFGLRCAARRYRENPHNLAKPAVASGTLV